MNLEQVKRAISLLEAALKELHTVEATESVGVPVLNEVRKALQELKMQDRVSMTISEASRITGISTPTLHRYVKIGKLRTKKPNGGAKIVMRDDLMNLLNELNEK